MEENPSGGKSRRVRGKNTKLLGPTQVLVNFARPGRYHDFSLQMATDCGMNRSQGAVLEDPVPAPCE